MEEKKSSNFGRTLWDLIAEFPRTSFFFLCLTFIFIGAIVGSLIYKKYSFKSPVFSFDPTVPVISQDTSKKSKLDTAVHIREVNTPGKSTKYPRKQLIITTPNKPPIKSESIIINNNPPPILTSDRNGIDSLGRKLNLVTATQLLNLLPNKAENIDITSVIGDAEALRFASDIKEFLISQKYSSVNGINLAIFNNPIIGQYFNRDKTGVKIIIGSNIQRGK